MIGEEVKIRYNLIKDFNTLIDDHTLDQEKKKNFYRYCLHVFSTEEILKRHIKVCFKINGNKRIAMSKEDEYVKFKNYERKIKSLFIIHAHFERNLVPENSRKEKPE